MDRFWFHEGRLNYLASDASIDPQNADVQLLTEAQMLSRGGNRAMSTTGPEIRDNAARAMNSRRRGGNAAEIKDKSGRLRTTRQPQSSFCCVLIVNRAATTGDNTIYTCIKAKI